MTDRRIECQLRKVAHDFPDRICIRGLVAGQWQTLSYQDFFAAVDKLAEMLQKRGVVPGQRLILLAHNGVSAMVALFACLTTRASVVLIDPDLPGSELFRVIQLVDSAWLLVTEEVNLALGESLTVRHKVVVNQTAFQYSEREDAPEVRDASDYDESIATLLITSGTTGLPKAVMLTHSNYLYMLGFYRHFNLGDERDRVMTVLPLFHVACLITSIFIPMSYGASMIFIDALEPKTLQKAFQEGCPTILTAVPRLLRILDEKIHDQVKQKSLMARMLFKGLCALNYRLRQHVGSNLGRQLFKPIYTRFGGQLRTIMSGGAHLDADIQRSLYRYGFDVYSAYGLTETTGPIYISRLDKSFRFGSVGQVLPGSQGRIDAANHDGMGELCYQGPALMRGYFREPEMTAQVIKDGWFHTGDLGSLQQDNLFLSGRSKDLMVFADGKKAMPEAIEHFYQHIDGVADFAVVGLPVKGRSECIAVAAFVAEKEADVETVQQSIYARAAELNSPYRVMRVFSLDYIERSNTLKVKRHLLIARLAAIFSNEPVEPAAIAANVNNDNKASREKQGEGLDQVALMSWLASWIAERNAFVQQPVSYEQNFAELGVDSSQALQLCEALEEQFAVSIKPVALWSYTNIQQLALYAFELKSGAAHDLPVPAAQSVRRRTDLQAPIAVVAAHGRFPGGILGAEDLYQKLLEGFDGISDIPKSRWDIETVYDDDLLAPGKMNCRRGGFVAGLDDFDAKRFGLKPRMVATMDPQQKLMLTVVDELLHQQGLVDGQLAGSRTGAFFGVSSNDFLRLLIKQHTREQITMFMSIGNTYASIAGRVAYHYDFRGPVSVVDTACSSSLVAVHQAMQALRLGECDVALAGGVNCILDPDMTICLSKARMLSPDGVCKTFDASANGFVRSEGCGVVLLKRMSDVTDRDEVLALIEGSAVNHDGHSNNFTAPNGVAQAECYQAALQSAGVEPGQLTYLETHGTGTVLGDPIEVDSIQKVYTRARMGGEPLILGAVKSNLGHCEAAAGIAGFIKAVMSLKHGVVPGNLHLQQLNPHIQMRENELLFPRGPQPLSTHSAIHAAVSSFGITGTNAHVLLKSV